MTLGDFCAVFPLKDDWKGFKRLMTREYLCGWDVFAVEFRDGSDVRRFLHGLTYSFRNRSCWGVARYTGIDVLIKGQMPRYLFACLLVKSAG